MASSRSLLELSKLALQNTITASFRLPNTHIPLLSNPFRLKDASLQTSFKHCSIGRFRNTWGLRAQEDDFEVEEVIDMDAEKEEEEEEGLEDYETDFDVGKPRDREYPESDTFVSTRGEAAESVVDYKISEEEFHKLSLQHCDFFIRKVPDPDEDVYDFREMYVTDPDTDVYAIPTVEGRMPQKPVRLTKSNFEHICCTELPVDSLRAPMFKHENQVMKIFLIKHFKNRRADAWNFVLDFEQIYVIDSKAKSISRANVTLNVPGGVNRDRSEEVLIVRDDGTTFRVIPMSQRKSPDHIVQEKAWNRTKENLDNYLRSFRDYHVSNWF